MIKTKKLKVSSNVTKVSGDIVSVDGEVKLSEENITQMFCILEKWADRYWYKKHSDLVETMYLVRDTLVTLFEADDIGAIRNKLVNVIEEAIGAQK